MLIFGLGLVELLVFAALAVFLLVGISFDRRGKEELKWWPVILFVLFLAGWNWSDWTFFGPAHVEAVMDGTKVVTPAYDRVVLFSLAQSAAFWTPVAIFLGLGLVYSLVEFLFDIRRSAKFYAAEWAEYLKKTVDIGGSNETVRITISDLLTQARAGSDNKRLIEYAQRVLGEFRQRYSFKNRIVGLEYDEKLFEMNPKVNKAELVDFITAWTLLWPFYLVSLILGDLLTEVFNAIGEFFVKLTGQFVKVTFKDVFKLS